MMKKMIKNVMMAAVTAFVGDASQSDDLTLLALKYMPNTKGQAQFLSSDSPTGS